MKRVLLVNACVRSSSRTLELAQALLGRLNGNIEEVDLYRMPMKPLDAVGMERRNAAAKKQDFSHTDFASISNLSADDRIHLRCGVCSYGFKSVLSKAISRKGGCRVAQGPMAESIISEKIRNETSVRD